MIKRGSFSFLLAASLLSAAPCPAAEPSPQPKGEQQRLEVTRDTWVSDVGSERDGNNGGAPRLKTKSIQELAIVDIDPKSLAGRVILSATLHLHCASPQQPQRTLTVSSLASDWAEGTSTGYKPQKGAASFRWAKQDEQPWAWPGSDLIAVCLGNGGTVWRLAEATPPDKDGWQTVSVSPAVVAARVAGISHGFVVMDDVGSEYERQGDKLVYNQFPNRFFSSREDRKWAPYFTVTLGEADRQPPAAPRDIKPAAGELPPGEAAITWVTPADAGGAGTIGFVARVSDDPAADWDKATLLPQYLLPAAGAADQIVSMHLRDLPYKAGQTIALLVRAVDGAGNVGPAAKAAVKLSDAPAMVDIKPSPIKPFDATGERPRLGSVQVAIIDALDKVQPSTGQMVPNHPESYLQGNHLWSAAGKTIRLHAARNEFVDFQVLLSGQTEGITATLAFDEAGDAAPKAQLYRFRHVKTKAGDMPDPLAPLGGPVAIPAADEKIAGQKHAAILADVYVPHTAKPGPHAGTLTLKSGGESLALRVELNVWDFTLPDHLSFLPEMNCYGLPDSPNDLAYYRLAQVHRTCLNRLGYSWSGNVNANAAPKWMGNDFDWAAWDRHYGPLLDGSAFADLPRKGVPIEALYLQLNENWPIPIANGFIGGYWADRALTPEYRKAFVDAAAKTASHLAAKGWKDTFFEFYLNNKVYYKKDRGWSGCSAPWIFDEPVHTQDFWALRYYGAMFHEGVAAARGQARFAFRCDISRPQWQRDLLDGVLDVNVVGGELRRYSRMIADSKIRNGQVTINYGSSNHPQSANIQPAAWCLDTWMLGFDGVLPWQTVGTAKSWQDGDECCLFYPGAPAASPDPIASVRLKSYRRGQQDVEYLTLLAATTRQPRFAIANSARAALKLSAKVTKTSEDDAGLVGYGGLDPAALWDLRLRVGSMLDTAKPPAKDKLVNFRTPPRTTPEPRP